MFVDEPDGYYEYRVEAGRMKARWCTGEDEIDVDLAEVTTFGAMEVRYLPLPHPIPRYKKVLRWRWT